MRRWIRSYALFVDQHKESRGRPHVGRQTTYPSRRRPRWSRNRLFVAVRGVSSVSLPNRLREARDDNGQPQRRRAPGDAGRERRTQKEEFERLVDGGHHSMRAHQQDGRERMSRTGERGSSNTISPNWFSVWTTHRRRETTATHTPAPPRRAPQVGWQFIRSFTIEGVSGE